ncbi:MAG: DNA/RNA non-specific endonuclease [Acidobacteria bacterium]|nr:DNA/RNA non-specific endonuclease [Acidobacteriota bacterium]
MQTTLLLLFAIGTLSAQPDRFGLPACDAPGQHLAIRSAFILCHDSNRKVAAWTAYELTPENLNTPAAPRRHFRRDPELAASASDADYRHSGFHRSHLVPARDMASSPDALRESYFLSNAVPQLPELNLSAWRRIENDIRKLAAHSDSLYILTGTLFDCDTIQRIGPNQVAVPCAIFKIAIALSGETKSAYAVILPNHPAAARQTVSIREVETRAGLDFLSSLPATEQDILESIVIPLH